MCIPENAETPQPRLKPDTLAVSIAILLIVSVIQRMIGFGRGILFCRWLTPEELGHWEMAYSFLLMAAPVVVLGLPGSFGRYLERYRQRGQLRTFLRRATIWTTALTITAIGAVMFAAPWFSNIVFGRPDERSLILLMAGSLVAIIAHHFLEALFAALRKFRIVSAMHFCQSTLFATISLALLWWWRAAAESIIIGYGIACLISAVGALVWNGRGLIELSVPDEGVPHFEFWPPLVRFAVWVWLTNVLSHLFGIVDRYMLVHWSGLDSEAALALVGHYHASRVIPLLFISLADLVAGVVMPYLSHDWELGHREKVSDRLNLVLKLTSVGMLLAGVGVLWTAPALFHVAFEGRYDAGLVVLPWTLTYCAWYAQLIIAQNYLWCAERAKYSIVPLALGLLANIAINAVLIPIWGLYGAATSTTVSTGLALVALYALNRWTGMRVSPGMLLLSATPAALVGGAGFATALTLILLALLPFSQLLVSDQERSLLRSLYTEILARLSTTRPGRQVPLGPVI